MKFVITSKNGETSHLGQLKQLMSTLVMPTLLGTGSEKTTILEASQIQVIGGN